MNTPTAGPHPDAPAAGSRPSAMTDFGLADEEFFGDTSRVHDDVTSRLFDEGFAGIRIDAPKQILTSERDTFPVIACEAGKLSGEGMICMADHGVLVAIDTTTNRLHAGLAEPPPQDADIIQEVPPGLDLTPPSPTAYGSSFKLLELRGQLGVTWEPGDYRVRVLTRDRSSNVISVELLASPGAFKDEEVEKFIAERQAGKCPGPVVPGIDDPLPSYEQTEDSLPVPDETGISLSAERVDVLKDGSWHILRGAFRLPVLDSEVVRGDWEFADPDYPDDPAPTAVIGIGLVIIGADQPGPTLLRMNVPVYTPVDGEATGHFALDLIRHAKLPRTPQTYFIYAFNGESMDGPAVAGLVDEAQLPNEAEGK